MDGVLGDPGGDGNCTERATRGRDGVCWGGDAPAVTRSCDGFVRRWNRTWRDGGPIVDRRSNGSPGVARCRHDHGDSGTAVHGHLVALLARVPTFCCTATSVRCL